MSISTWANWSSSLAKWGEHQAKTIQQSGRNPDKPGAPPHGAAAVPAFPGITGLGWISFESYGSSQSYNFTCLLGNASPDVKDGYAGWQTVSRQRRRALTQWVGNNPLTIDIPVIFDGWAANISQEYGIRQLEKMAGLEEGMDQPPFVAFDSHGVVPHDSTNAGHVDWVISALQFGTQPDTDVIRRAEDGDRVRQTVTITVMQVVDEDRLSAASPAQKKRAQQQRQAARGRAQKGARKKKYVVKDGETLETIAAKPHSKGGLGSAKRWREIKKLNPKFRQPNKTLPLGTVLAMP